MAGLRPIFFAEVFIHGVFSSFECDKNTVLPLNRILAVLEVDHIWVFLTILPVIAFLYSAVGHGGASGYLAVMALFGFAPDVMKPTALLLNLFVAALSFMHYWRAGYFNLRLFISFAITSIPLAFLGGIMEIDASLYKKILGVLLLIAIARMLNLIGRESGELKKVRLWQGLLTGAIIGFFSGLIGIGGGIILSPIILLMRWGRMKEAAAVSALFIWVNSAAGLGGQISSGVRLESWAFLLVAVAAVGGFLGAYFGSRRLANSTLRYMLAFVLIIACIKLFLT